MQMTTGQLNRRISILTQSTAQDSFGAPVTSWTPVYQCWASIDVQNSQLQYSTAEFISKTTYRITIRYTSSVSITPAMRIQYTDPAGLIHTYEVESLVNIQQGNQWVLILAYELQGAL